MMKEVMFSFISRKNSNGLIILFAFLVGFSSCNNEAEKGELDSSEKFFLLKQGYWSAELEIDEGNQIPFLFQVIKDSIFFINGKERIGAVLEKEASQFEVKMPIFDSEFIFSAKDNNVLIGHWNNYAKSKDYTMVFSAKYKGLERVTTLNEDKSKPKVEGKWEVVFSPLSPEQYNAIGVFEEQGKNLTGTFITETGDYRFLEGEVDQKKLFLSCFDGAHAFLFKAAIKGDSLVGEFFSGNHYKAVWKAQRNAGFELSHPDSIVKAQEDMEIAFELPSLTESSLVYPNSDYENKVVIIQVMGSWCPNCMDETALFTSFYNAYNKDGLEVIGVAFETPKTLEGKKERVMALKNYFNAGYDFAIGGNASKVEAQKVFPALEEVVSFPTAIFIDKKGVVRKVHTGFYGPGTGSYYAEYVQNTQKFIEQLLSE